jgi:hypothetical protein
VWETTVDGRPLRFHLAGINNQNFIMRDEETGSWWQQVSGVAILGPLKGKRLKGVLHDELTFATWRGEEPNGRVLRPDEHTAAVGNYVPANWEELMTKVPVATLTRDNALEQRTLVIGLKLNGAAKAYPLTALQKQNPVIDRLGGVPLVIVIGGDGRSVRAFETSVNGRKLEFFRKSDSVPVRLVDAETGSEWDFSGKATSGPLSGNQLKKILALSDYWFDWKTYNPDTAIYLLGER